jgi:glycosyltransferase involved in cell wall biosynthesis
MEVRIFGVEDDYTQVDLSAWSPLQVKSSRLIGPADFGYVPELVPALKRFGPDVVHTHGLWMYQSVATRRYCANSCPYLVSPHGMLDPWALRNSRFKKFFAYWAYERAHLKGAHCLRALCTAEATAIQQLNLMRPIVVIPNGVDLPEPHIGEHEVNGPLAMHVNAGRKILLYLGRIHPKKGLLGLLRAWEHVQREARAAVRPWVLAVAGWDQGGHELELMTLASNLDIPWVYLSSSGDDQQCRIPNSGTGRQGALGATLLFLGPQHGEAKNVCYRLSDAFVLPSYSEGIPTVVLESWAYAKPVIMTAHCNLPEGIALGAAIHTSTQPEAIAKSLLQLFEMSDRERSEMGGVGRMLVGQKFDWSRLGQQMTGVYHWMLGSGGTPSCTFS